MPSRWSPVPSWIASVAPLIVALVVAYVDSVWGVVAGIGCGLLLFGCAQVRPTRPIAQTVATLAVVGALGVVGVHAVHRHVLMLLLMVASTLMLGSLWRKVPQGDRIRIDFRRVVGYERAIIHGSFARRKGNSRARAGTPGKIAGGYVCRFMRRWNRDACFALEFTADRRGGYP